MRPVLDAAAFPPGTPLNAFFAWNEARLLRDRRYVVACDLHALFRRLGGGAEAVEACVYHLVDAPRIGWRWRDIRWYRRGAAPAAALGGEAAAAGRRLVESLMAAIGSGDRGRHADFFAACDALEGQVDLAALARALPRLRPSRRETPQPRRILVIKLSALGDFIQALGPAAAIRRHHPEARITLLTTAPYAEFARLTGLFDAVAIDRRPRLADLAGWRELRRFLRRGGFDRVYDLQTSDRSSLYARLFLPGRAPEWSGIAWRCALPHANLARDPQHTIDKQAEQLLMAGIHPVPLPALPPVTQPLPQGLVEGGFVLLIPGSSPHRPEKRWPAEKFGALALRLEALGLAVVVVGGKGEEALAARLREICPSALDLVGETDLMALAGLARAARLTIGNDTGASHIAAAGGRAVLVLFSAASEPARCAPRGQVRVLVERRLADLPVETVLDEAMRLLAAEPAAEDRHRPLPSTTG